LRLPQGSRLPDVSGARVLHELALRVSGRQRKRLASAPQAEHPVADRMSSRTPLVSILVPAYNAGRYLREFCESVRAQTYPHFEVLVANDGSTDDTASVLFPFLKDERFRLLGWEQNRGLNRAWATLCSLAGGEYWCSPGADDVLYPSYLERRVATLEANPQAVLAHGPVELINERGAAARHGPLPLTLPPELGTPRSVTMLLQHNVIAQPSALVRTSVTRQVLPFFCCDWVFSPDWYFWLLHAATGFDLLWEPTVLVKYRVHSASLSVAAEKDSIRRAEITLAPLCALSTAARFSSWAAEAWIRWRSTLYQRWLLRALKLQLRGGAKKEWLRLGAAAFYGNNRSHVSLAVELCRHAPGIGLTRLREQKALRRQTFRVSGVAQVNDPVFQ
jgi:glycosyltransferase involved in cell wall biosynthesis